MRSVGVVLNVTCLKESGVDFLAIECGGSNVRCFELAVVWFASQCTLNCQT